MVGYMGLFSELPLKQALHEAERVAKEKNVVLYLLRGGTEDSLDSNVRGIIWKPDGWVPREG